MNKRKEYPLFEGVIKYFPNALLEVAHISYVGSQQHNPGEPMFWDKTKSKDNADALLRHLTDYAKGVELDEDGLRHLGKVAWRALALLEASIETVEK